MLDLRIEFTVQPRTVAAAVYGVMTVVSEHTSSLARLDDLRVALDEIFYALPQDRSVRVDLRVEVDDECSRIIVHADARDVVLHHSVASLVDELTIAHDPDGTTAALAVAHA